MSLSESPASQEARIVGNNWPMDLDVTRVQIKKAQQQVERYRTALRLAGLEIERRNRAIIGLANFAYRASRIATPADLLKLSLMQAVETPHAPVGAIVLVNAETKELTLGVHKGVNPALFDILTGQQLEKGARALMPHLVAGTGALLEYHTADDEMERLLLAASQLSSLVSLPLQAGAKLIGALLVGLRDDRRFSPAELCFLMALSHETAIALESLHLREGLWFTAAALLGGQSVAIDLEKVGKPDLNFEFTTPFELPSASLPIPEPAEEDVEQLLAVTVEAEEKIHQQYADLQTLNTVAKLINQTRDLRAILLHTVEQTKTSLKMDAAWLYLVDKDNQLDLRAHIGLSTDYVRGMQNLPANDGLEGRVFADNRPYFVESVATDPYRHKIWVDKEQLQALAAVPITRPNPKSDPDQATDVAGVLAVGKRTLTNYPWSSREIRLLVSIANQIAPAIDNARLYAQMQDNETSLKVGNEILRNINDMLLEKNTFLEGFITDDLVPALNVTAAILQRLRL